MPAVGLKKLYIAQKAAAKQRGIPFLLTFAEWQQIWSASGRLGDRGCERGQYCMARFGDQGGYEVGNVEIILTANNTTQGNIGSKNSHAKVTPDIVREIRAAYVKGSRGSNSVGALAKRYGLAPTTIRDIVNYVNWKHVT